MTWVQRPFGIQGRNTGSLDLPVGWAPRQSRMSDAGEMPVPPMPVPSGRWICHLSLPRGSKNATPKNNPQKKYWNGTFLHLQNFQSFWNEGWSLHGAMLVRHPLPKTPRMFLPRMTSLHWMPWLFLKICINVYNMYICSASILFVCMSPCSLLRLVYISAYITWGSCNNAIADFDL